MRRPANVLVLDEHRRRRYRHSETHTALYVTESGAWRESLGAFPFLELVTVDRLLTLKGQLLRKTPDVILVEASLTWEDPLELIERLASLTDAPVVLIYEPADLKRCPELLKLAFNAGVHDTLMTPLRREVVLETVDVLLKLRHPRTLP